MVKVVLTSDFWADANGKVYGRGAEVDMPADKAEVMIANKAAKEPGAQPVRVVGGGVGEFYRLAAIALGSHHKRRAEMASAAGAPADADAEAQKLALVTAPDAMRLDRVVERMQAVEQGWA